MVLVEIIAGEDGEAAWLQRRDDTPEPGEWTAVVPVSVWEQFEVSDALMDGALKAAAVLSPRYFEGDWRAACHAYTPGEAVPGSWWWTVAVVAQWKGEEFRSATFTSREAAEARAAEIRSTMTAVVRGHDYPGFPGDPLCLTCRFGRGAHEVPDA